MALSCHRVVAVLLAWMVFGVLNASDSGGLNVTLASGSPSPNPAYVCQQVSCNFDQAFDWSDPRVRREVNEKTSKIKQALIMSWGEQATDKGRLDEVSLNGRAFTKDATWKKFKVTFLDDRRRVRVEQTDYEPISTLITKIQLKGVFHATGVKRITIDSEILVMTDGGGPYRFTDSEYAEVTINALTVQIDGDIYGEQKRRMEDIAGGTENTVASGWVKFLADVPKVAGVKFSYQWTFSGGTADTGATSKSACNWDAPDTETPCTVTLNVGCSHGESMGTAQTTINPIRPRVVRVRFEDSDKNNEQQISPLADADPEYDRIATPAVNHPACYVMNTKMLIRADLAGAETDDHVNNLTMRTLIDVEAEAEYGGARHKMGKKSKSSVDETTTDWSRQDYTDVALECKDKFPKQVALFDRLVIHWKFWVKSWKNGKIPSYKADGEFCMATTHFENIAVPNLPARDCALFATIAEQKFTDPAQFIAPKLRCACDWASPARDGKVARPLLMTNGFVAHYTWDMDCNVLASAFVHYCRTLGLVAELHRWSSNADEFGGDVGDMCYQRTRVVDPVGPVYGSGQVDWSWHQWVESEGTQWDPSANGTLKGSWGDYEDHCFSNYKHCVTGPPVRAWNWDANQKGQTNGCEPRGIPEHGDTLFTAWREPMR